MSLTLISETEEAKNWISQFDEYDKAIARNFLNSIKYVSSNEFEKNIHDQLLSLTDNQTKRLGVYPIIKSQEGEAQQRIFIGQSNANTPASTNKRKNNQRKIYGSEDRVGHVLENISRAYKKNNGVSTIEIIPTLHSVMCQKIKRIVLIDDICGSGRRIIDFYRKEIPSILKRYISLNIIELYIILYTTTNAGKQNVFNNINYFKQHPERFIIAYPENNITKRDEIFMKLCSKYYSRHFVDKGVGLGYRNSFSKIVFEHGCPNNAPAILHEFNNSKRNKWNALFHKRSTSLIVTDSFFSNENRVDFPEILWDFNQNILALQFLERENRNALDIEQKLIISLLGLIAKQVPNPESHLLLNKQKFNELISKMDGAKFISLDCGFKITELGKKVLEKFRVNKKQKNKFERSQNNYYPITCGNNNRLGK